MIVVTDASSNRGPNRMQEADVERRAGGRQGDQVGASLADQGFLRVVPDRVAFVDRPEAARLDQPAERPVDGVAQRFGPGLTVQDVIAAAERRADDGERVAVVGLVDVEPGGGTVLEGGVDLAVPDGGHGVGGTVEDGDPDVPAAEPLGVDVGGRHPQDADLPGAAAGARELEVGPRADRAVAAGHQGELIDVIRASRQVVAGPGLGQLVAVDDDVDLAAAEDRQEVFPLRLAEDRLDAQFAADPVHQLRFKADPGSAVGPPVDVRGSPFLVRPVDQATAAWTRAQEVIAPRGRPQNDPRPSSPLQDEQPEASARARGDPAICLMEGTCRSGERQKRTDKQRRASVGAGAVPAGPTDPLADRPREPGLAEPGEPADHEPVPPPVDPPVEQGVEPDREQEQVLDRAEQEVADPWEVAAEPIRLGGVADDPQADQDHQAAPGDPGISRQGPDKADGRQVQGRFDQKGGERQRRRILNQRECRFKNQRNDRCRLTLAMTWWLSRIE